MKNINIFYILLSCMISLPSHAWDLKDIGLEAASPLTTDAKYVLIGGTAITLTLVIFEDEVIDPFQQKQVRNKSLGHSSRWGDWIGQWVPNLLYMAGTSVAGYYGDSEGYRRSMGMLKATSYSTLVTTALKYTVREPRPIDSDWKNSFPSGHSTTAFAFSGYVAAEHGWKWGLPATLISAFVGYSRINDNMHWLQDVTAGATIGWVYGWGISKYQRKELSTYVMPILDTHTAGLGLYKEF
jgi:membrane-associated phospholipid phosphatase